MRFYPWLLAVILAWLGGTAHAAIGLDDATHRLDLESRVSYLKDPEARLSIQEVQDHPGFERHTASEPVNLGFTEAALWIRIRLEYQGPEPDAERSWFLEVATPSLDRVDLYRPRANGGYSLTRSGDSVPFSERALDYANIVHKLRTPSQQSVTYYLRVRSAAALLVPLTLWEPDALIEHVSSRHQVFGLFFGIMTAMLIYNLFLLFSIRDTSYLHYILYIGSFILLQASVQGFTFQYLWPGMPLLAQLSSPVLSGMTAFFALQFTRTFLGSARHIPRIDALLVATQALAVLTSLVPLTGAIQAATYCAVVLGFTASTAMLVAASVLLRRGHRSARFFLLAWFALLAGIFIHLAMLLSWLPPTWLTRYAMQIGSTVEVLLLSLALADRINTMQREKADAEAQAKAALERSNQELEELVAERTEELERTLEEVRSQNAIVEEQRRELETLAGTLEERVNDKTRELREALVELEKSNHAKDEFLGTIGHELRTPMNGVLGTLDLLALTSVDERQREYIQTALTSARHMMRLLEDILTFSELQAGDIRLDSRPFEVAQLLDEITAEPRRLAEAKGLALDYRLAPSVPHRLRGDTKRLKQIIAHLLDNALKFTEAGSVTLTVSAESDTGAPGEALTLHLRVDDTGVGFSPETNQQLFESFQQGDGSFNRKYGGLGIGLALCQKLATLLDGEINVASQPQGGTSCYVSLQLEIAESEPEPADEPAQPGLPHQPSQAPSSTTPATVLVVEDNGVNQMVTQGILEKLGYRVVTADNGEQALKELEQTPVDAVLMDCQMPVMDGFEATRRIRRMSGALSAVPIIAVTANALSSDREQCLEAGMDDYVKKPIKLSRLRDTLAGWLMSAHQA